MNQRNRYRFALAFLLIGACHSQPEMSDEEKMDSLIVWQQRYIDSLTERPPGVNSLVAAYRMKFFIDDSIINIHPGKSNEPLYKEMHTLKRAMDSLMKLRRYPNMKLLPTK